MELDVNEDIKGIITIGLSDVKYKIAKSNLFNSFYSKSLFIYNWAPLQYLAVSKVVIVYVDDLLTLEFVCSGTRS